MRAKVRPLLIRPGTHYACAGDGLCCSDMHKIAPLNRVEVQRLRLLDEDSAGLDEDLGENAISLHEGRCLFLRGDGLCDIHHTKPRVCHRFPYTLVATPHGGRVSIEHRCTCPNLSPADAWVTPERATEDLADAAGRLKANHRVESVVLNARRRVTFERYLELEAPVLFGLRHDPEKALKRPPFGQLKKTSYREIHQAMVDQDGETRLDAALRFFGDAIGMHLGYRAPRRERPWAEDIARAKRRASPVPIRPMYSHWLANSIWSLMWTAYASFEQCLGELATRLWIAQSIAKRLDAQGARGDIAAAEAILITDLVGASEWWEGAVSRLRH